MGNIVSIEKKVKRLEAQIKKYKDNPKFMKRLAPKLLTIKPREKKK